MRRHSTAVALAVSVVTFAACAGSAVAAITSPDEMCAYYESRWEQGLMRVIQKPPPKCIVRVGDTGSGIGYIEGYYKGGTFCMKSSGAYFTNAGLKESTECVTVAGGTGTTMRNRFADFLKDPNLKWYAAAAVAIAVLSLLSGRLIDRRKKQ